MDATLKSLQAEWQVDRPADRARVPLYHQLYSLLKAAIVDGRIGFQERMPTEQQIVDMFDVSRITAKRAMDELAADNLVQRRRGKGTHVVYRYEPDALRAPLVATLESYRELAKRSTPSLVSSGQAVPPRAVGELLGMAPEESALKVVRIMKNADGLPYSCYTSWTPGSPSGMTRRRLEKKSRLELLEEAGIDLHRVRQILGAETASITVAEWLNVQPGAALLSLERHTFDRQDNCVDVVFGLYNPALFKYSLDTQ
ncbi:MAG: GntR family transcriptional regulator [Pseudomonadota bacterium]